VTPETELVVSTHPFACAALALLRRRGDLTVPAVTYLTDPSVHPFWVHPGIDVHVAIYAEAQRQALGRDAAGVVLVQPPVDCPTPMTAHRRAALLAAAGAPSVGRVAFVVGGSEGLGDLVAASREVRRSGQLTPVVVCGHNTALQEALSTEPGVVALPWVDHFAELLVAGDVVVQNAGGFTVLESLAAGVPVVTYRPLPGHGRSNGAALAADGLAAYAEDEEALAGALADALRRPRTPPDGWSLRPSLAEALLPLLAPVDAHRALPAATVGTDLLTAS
jgi:UDP-N-acetylglucosamine:LPS N-acetylglucosamine transferase